jgi:probable F420-dependent oxidoreductase
MLFGVHVFPTEFSIQPDELARAAEERGLESVWFSEHSHIPLRFLNGPDNNHGLPDYYWQTYDIFVAMTLAAAVTQTIKIGPGVALLIERDLIFTAKEVATLDLLSKGRFLFGIGAGWLESEMADHGVVYRTRFQLLREQIEALKVIWTADEAEYHGKFVNFEAMKAFPKPYQRPHPPIIMGGSGEKVLQITAEVCDGWAPWGLPWEQAREAISGLKQRAAGHGRDPDALEISLFYDTLPEASILAEMEAEGVRRVIVSVHAQNHETALPILDQLAEAGRSSL